MDQRNTVPSWKEIMWQYANHFLMCFRSEANSHATVHSRDKTKEKNVKLFCKERNLNKNENITMSVSKSNLSLKRNISTWLRLRPVKQTLLVPQEKESLNQISPSRSNCEHWAQYCYLQMKQSLRAGVESASSRVTAVLASADQQRHWYQQWVWRYLR